MSVPMSVPVSMSMVVVMVVMSVAVMSMFALGHFGSLGADTSDFHGAVRSRECCLSAPSRGDESPTAEAGDSRVLYSVGPGISLHPIEPRFRNGLL